MEMEHEPDVLDRASNLESAERDACVAAQRAKPAMKATGYCLDPGCFAPLPKGQLFCGDECRDFYEKQERMNRITGRK
ncbi:MAG: hypothetical protein M0Z99_20415 [Betaproteobacteria bacterium]|nr:hypothetical protein [Betaproteobacteria bacterium]